MNIHITENFPIFHLRCKISKIKFTLVVRSPPLRHYTTNKHNSVRPVVVGMSCTGVTSDVAIKATTPIVRDLCGSHNLGIRKGGYEAAVHVFREFHFPTNPNQTIPEVSFSGDYANAFNSFSRSLSTDLVCLDIPNIAKYILSLYEDKSILLTSEGDFLYSKQGNRQGCKI